MILNYLKQVLAFKGYLHWPICSREAIYSRIKRGGGTLAKGKGRSACERDVQLNYLWEWERDHCWGSRVIGALGSQDGSWERKVQGFLPCLIRCDCLNERGSIEEEEEARCRVINRLTGLQDCRQGSVSVGR